MKMLLKASVLYFTLSSLTAGSRAQAHSGHSKHSCAIEPNAIVSDACASYQTLDDLSTTLYPQLQDVTQNSDFFSYYRLNLYNRECPYWDDSTASCGNIACAVNTINEEDIPETWRMSELSKLRGPKAEHPSRKKQAERTKQKPLQGDLGDGVDESCVVEYDDECDERDYCIPEDAGSPGKGDYVSLLDNPERFTGYSGDHAHSVWDSIYRENCFTKPSPPSPPFSNPLAPMRKGLLEKGSAGPAMLPFVPDDSCLEKRVFYRIISGMHASISTHICHEYLNQTTGIWSPNLECYDARLHGHPDRVSNLYFNFALVTRAVAKLTPYLPSYTFCAGDPTHDAETKQKIVSLAETAAKAPSVFDEMLMFRDPDMVELKSDFRTRFRNVSRIMDCVGCDKCRLWGKLQTNGYGTALKVLFEFNGDTAPAYDSRPLKRTELVSLVNTMARLGKSMKALKEFRELMHTDDVAKPPSASQQLPLESKKRSEKGENRTKKTGQYVGSKGALLGLVSAEPVGDRESDKQQVEEEVPDSDHEPSPEMTDWEVAAKELRQVYRACIWVIKQWWELPSKILAIIVYQLNRAWSWWVGLYVEPPLEWRWADNPFERDEL